ncbi:MAG: hypothetical protein A3G45_02910 [Candidatus Staskawiczbacteria bacterium RIFCSPLOWO2_12_FULL_37_15]|uniref:Uncharacterized protein n=1 Tax=Candidatus Staskawiczbacteria bacterium RIFCSPLOWO2_12_FULL_37_15 TaxID=1802218 RepID=A0A1G2ILK7_9BACT|nr:MAG: hypothetical protein US35_C0008G0009 [Parcubacteria group bacterium GW2011_GWA2_37_10]OGZ75437.1 MAG: hypothetical protein A3G45_02910 [Candidatus Staskawiczbacteria bacterium RIFCSPLOWO2_12_FULL_37_15]HLD38236.1 hypothetical protein [Candidatus Nanoarchaeia archaeon]
MGKFNFNQEEFERVKSEAEKLYQTFEPVYNPYFAEKVSFNAKGLRHLKFKSDQQARAQKDQYPRLKLLHLAPQILRKSHTLQGIWQTRQFENNNTNGQWKYLMKDIIFYEFIAVLENIRVKVIVKEVLGGEKHFWSIIPYWSIDKASSKRILCSGNPYLD